MTITLRAITKDNWRQIMRLNLTDEQRAFVADNAYSMLQAHYEPEYKLTPLAIYADDTPAGFVMYGSSEHEGRELWAIWRLMLDVTHQRQGYGRAAIQQTIAHIQATIGCAELYISFVPANVGAQKLYASLGFEDTGLIEDGEIVYKLDLRKA